MVFQKFPGGPFVYHSCVTDVGLVQTDPLHFDPDKTIAALEGFLPFHETILSKLADQLCATDCQLVVSDISPPWHCSCGTFRDFFRSGGKFYLGLDLCRLCINGPAV